MILRIFSRNGNEHVDISVSGKTKLSQAIWLSGKLKPLPLCNGSGLCGKCAVRFLDNFPPVQKNEQIFFDADKLEKGWRLACQHYIAGNENRIINLRILGDIIQGEIEFSSVRAGDARQFAWLGIDLGTTSIAWKAVSEDGSNVFAKGNQLNPQAASGPDIVSRLAIARQGRESELSGLIKNFIADLLKELEEAGIFVQRICLAANSAMTEIFLEKNIDGLCSAPYSLSYKGNEELFVSEISCPILIPPLPGPFVGGDVSAGIAALLDDSIEKPFLLADLGTNGEIAMIAAEGSLHYTSVPMGPALEGIGPSMGALAGPEVAASFRLTGQGLLPLDMNGNALEKVSGISATGYISLLAKLLKLGVIDVNGKFVSSENIQMPLGKKIGLGLIDSENGMLLQAGFNISLTSNDIELILMVKAAFSVALDMLLQKSGIRKNQIRNVCMAGALGKYASLEDLGILGFLPSDLLENAHAVGNTSLEGACIFAKSPEKLKKMACLCEKASSLDLAGDSRFQKQYVDALHWGWTGQAD